MIMHVILKIERIKFGKKVEYLKPVIHFALLVKIYVILYFIINSLNLILLIKEY